MESCVIGEPLSSQYVIKFIHCQFGLSDRPVQQIDTVDVEN